MLLLCLAAACAAALVAPTLGRRLGSAAGWPISAMLLGVGLLVVLVAQPEAVTAAVPWMPTLGVELALRLDGLSMLFSLLVLGVGALVMAYSARYLPSGRHGSFYGLMTLFAAAMLALVLADDVVLLFVAWEATTLCSFFLISRSGAGAREPAIRTLLVTAAGGLALLSAVVVMVAQVGSTRLSVILADPVWSENGGFTTAVAVLVAVAAFTKSAQLPFQAWLPDSMVAITPVSAYLHAAAMVKAGIYLLLRFSPVMADVPVWRVLLISCGLTTALIGALAAVRRYDLKELLAYSTMSQLGLLVATIGIGTPAALTAAAVHTAAHALFKSALFMLVGVVDHQAGTRDMRRLSGLRRTMPVTCVAMTVAAASMAGVPPLLGFVSKESMLDAFWDVPGAGPALAVTVALVAVLTFVYSARLVIGAFGDQTGDPASAAVAPAGATAGETAAAPGSSDPTVVTDVTEARPAFWAPAVIPAAAGVVLGLAPWLLDQLVGDAASAAAGSTTQTHLTLWHGVTPALVLSVCVIVLGTAAVLARARLEPVVLRLRSPVSGLAVVDGLRARTISAGQRVGHLTSTSAPRRHLMVPVVCLVALAVVAATGVRGLPDVVGARDLPLDWGLLALLAVGTLAAVVARSRVAAIVVLGVVGFTMTVWFFSLGAADVALTQLLVEILTVVVMMLLLRRLPATFRADPKRSAVLPAVLALGAGAATTLGVLALTGRREMSPAGEYYVREGEAVTGGANVVNTILVDFRAFDTLGELTVLGVAGLTIVVLLRSRDLLPIGPLDTSRASTSPLADARANSVFTRVLTRLVGPLTVIVSLLLFFRGHQEPGGGFIAALVGGAGFALVYLSAPSDAAAKVRWPYLLLIGLGVATGTLTGFLGYVDGSFLTPLHADLLGVHLTSALLFDVGVYLAVVGVVLTTLNLLGRPRPSAHRAPPDAPSDDQPSTADHARTEEVEHA